MDGHLMAWALAIAIDVAMIAWGCRCIARLLQQIRKAGVAYEASRVLHDEDADAFELESEELSPHGLLASHTSGRLMPDADWMPDTTNDDRHRSGPLVNPASGLPMRDGVWVDVGGNPFGTDLSDDLGSGFDDIGPTFDAIGSGFDAFGSSAFDSGFSSLYDG
jgi:hypothetical protein